GLHVEGTVAVARQNRNLVGGIGYGEVQFAIPVQIANGDCLSAGEPGQGRVQGCGREGTVAGAQENGNCSGGDQGRRAPVIGAGEAQVAVPVQVANGDGERENRPGRVRGCGREATAAAAQQNRNRSGWRGIGEVVRVTTNVGCDEIQSAVPVQVTNGD